MFRTDPEEFKRRSKARKEFFHGAPKDNLPEWLHEVIQAATCCMLVSTPVPAGVQYAEEDGLHEVLVYPTPVELMGGAQDGRVATPSFSVDLDALRGVLDKIVDFGWEAHGHSETETPHVWLEGSHAGHNVLLRVLAFAP
ncbi:MAG: hypothetical protein N2C14_03745, partial [Planctomycetales bacterium]